MTSAERVPYDELAARDRERYKKKLEDMSYQERADLRRLRKHRRKRRGTNGYILFSKSVRNELTQRHPDASFADIGRLTGDRWRSLSQAERDEWNETAKESGGKK